MKIFSSPHRLWLLTGIIIAGIVAGYSFAIFNTPSVLGSSLQCPANCTGNNCPMNAR